MTTRTTTPTATFTTETIQPGDDSLFEQIDTEGSTRCSVCGSVDSIRTDEYPSMYAGTETTETCTVCGSWEGSGDPLKGTRRIQRHDGAEVTLTIRADKMIARGGFLYPLPADGYQYPTDPATLVDVRPGDRVAVTDHKGGIQTFVVTYAGRDEFGIYLRGDEWDDRGYYNMAPYAASTVHAITIVAG
jgi:hypothetical protein